MLTTAADVILLILAGLHLTRYVPAVVTPSQAPVMPTVNSALAQARITSANIVLTGLSYMV